MVIPGEFVGGALLGTAFSAVYDGLTELISKNLIFKSLFKEIKSSLDSLKPLIEQIEECNTALPYCSKEELEGLEKVINKGEELVSKCLKVSRWKSWNPFNKYKYANKLLDWDASLKGQLEILKIQNIRDGKKTAVAVQDMQVSLINIEKCAKNLQLTQSSSSSSTRLELPPLPKLIVGLDGPLKDLKEKLLCDDGESLLVLTAPGGCGKTTLATMFCKDEEVKGKFKNNIVFITVSQNGNLELVVKRLCEHVSFQNEVHIFQWMETFRKERPDPLLLVLDDIWSGQESILESFQSERSNHKVLVTSRSEFPRFSSLYQLKLLDDDNATKLFYHSASLGDKCSRTLEDLSKKIVKRCNGFPLAITVVGRSLSGQPLEVWRKREAEWTNGSNSILDSETKLFLCLQSSLNSLNKEFETVKDCYLDLGSFPEDKKIRVDQLIDMWAELYDLDNDSVLANVHELVNRNLATLVDVRNLKMEGEDFYDKLFVTQHDLLRELAIYNAKLDPVEQRERVFLEIKGNKIPKRWRREQTYRPVKARLLSITTDGNFDEHKWPEMQLPESEVLVLHFSSLGYRLPEFVEKMDKLKLVVMVGKGSSSSCSRLGNFEVLSSLPNLRSINLTGIEFPAIKKTAQFISLQKMSFRDCDCDCSVFHSDSGDVFPYVEEINFDHCHFHGSPLPSLCGLIHLKVLTFTNIFNPLPEEIGNLVNLEVLRVRNCRWVSKFPSSIKNLQKLSFLDISDSYDVVLPDCIGELSSLRKLDMRCGFGWNELPPYVSDLTQLKEVICNEDGARLWRPFLETLKNLRIVVIDKNSGSCIEIIQ